ncbi:hypothetical protein D0C16_15325 [Cellvibrio sp. KY-GH-1]|nr:hypothetical protein D0C16_15325 [Cellvibrio sp. KY-GH-1]
MNMIFLLNKWPPECSYVPNSSESHIVTQALFALKGETGLDFALSKQLPTDSETDYLIKTPSQTLAVEVKRNIRPAHLGAIIQHIKKLQPLGVLVADYLNPNIAKALKDNDVQYMDACGNSYLNLPPIYVNISGQKPAMETKQTKSRAFDTSGLKLVYGFLCDETLINASYREISGKTGVALGAIGKLLTDLKEAGYLINRNDLKWHSLINRRKLLDRWVEAYPEKLKPKLFVGEFISDNANWWKNVEIEKYDAYWSGEVAAAKYTDYLQPQVITVYVPEKSVGKLFATARLRKANNSIENTSGLIKVFRPFWPENNNHNNEYPNYLRKDTVHPILIYADLIASADSRNLEVARMLYESTIAEYIGED